MNEIPSKEEPPSNRDYDKFVRMMMTYSPRMRSFLRALLTSWHEVEEVSQEAALVAWQKFGELKNEDAFCGWLLTIARYEALKYRRKAARSPLIFSDRLWNLLADKAEDAAKDDNHEIRLQHLEHCMEKLDPDKQELLMQVYSSGMRTKDIAAMVGKSDQAFYKMIQRLRALLLDCITKALAAERV